MKITLEAEVLSEGPTSMTVRVNTGFGEPVMVISKDRLCVGAK